MEHLSGGEQQPYTTVLGLLQNMEKAGLVTHEEEGTPIAIWPPCRGRRQRAPFCKISWRGSSAARPRHLSSASSMPTPCLPRNCTNRGETADIGQTRPETQIMRAFVETAVAPLLELLADWSWRGAGPFSLGCWALVLWVGRPRRIPVSPIAFGVWHPIILVPPNWGRTLLGEMGPAAKDAAGTPGIRGQHRDVTNSQRRPECVAGDGDTVIAIADQGVLRYQ